MSMDVPLSYNHQMQDGKLDVQSSGQRRLGCGIINSIYEYVISGVFFFNSNFLSVCINQLLSIH